MMRRVKAEGKGDALSAARVTAGYGLTRAGAGPRGRAPALRDVSFALRPGELVIVLGPNGAGKSTLVRVLAGVLAPAAGEVRIGGDDARGLDRSAIARRVAVVPQETDVAFGFTVREVVAMGRAPHQTGWMRATSEDEQAVGDAVGALDLGSLADRPVQELSGGEKRRVAVARALAQATPALLLDEPTAALDVHHQIALFDRLVAGTAGGLACLVVMHDLNLAAQYATRIVLMRAGAVVADGPIDQVLTWQRLKDTFDADLYCGLNEVTGTRFFLPMRGR